MIARLPPLLLIVLAVEGRFMNRCDCLPLLAASAVIVAATCSWAFGRSCDTWVAMHDATTDGSVILAKNSDRPPMEAQQLVQFRRFTHQPGEVLRCTYLEIPQAGETYSHIGSRIWWTFGYEHGMNEHGVAIGNEAVWSKEPYEKSGLLGMDLLRLGLERGKTAYEAMHVIITLLEKHGQGGDCERQGEWGGASYHNSYLIADPSEAWVLETAGRYWAAIRIRKGVYSISNIYTIETVWDEAHPRLVEHAIEKGWCNSKGEFNFARHYGDYWGEESPDPGAMQIRRNATLSYLENKYRLISPENMMNINRDHLEGTVVKPRWSPAEPFWATPCAHDSPRGKYRTVASMVAHLRRDKPPLLRQVYWAGFSNPCCGVFQPFYLNGPRIPKQYSLGTSTYSSDAPWWWATRIKVLCDLNYPVLNPRVREVFGATEQWQLHRQQECEVETTRLLADGNREAAVARIQAFVDQNSDRVDREYRALNVELPQLLEKAGIKYLFTDYLDSWTSKSRLPMPPPFVEAVARQRVRPRAVEPQ
ncbi:MAG: C69 family dipeptidase [Thermoguttaceae bacterium]|jgi:secernin